MLQDLKYIDFIQGKYEERKLGNTSYSLRAFARDLGVSPSRLSEILSGKGNITSKTALKIASNLKLQDKEIEIFISLVNLSNASSKKSKKQASSLISDLKKSNHRSLSIETFNLVSEWYYFAILSVMELDLFDGTAAWICSRIGVDLNKIQNALNTLEKLEFIECKNQKYNLVAGDGLTTTSDIESMALKKSHKQSLLQAIDALDNVSVEDRDITSITMAIDPKKLPEAKKLIKNFRRELCVYLESGKKSEVYNLNIQLLPITKLEKKSKEML